VNWRDFGEAARCGGLVFQTTQLSSALLRRLRFEVILVPGEAPYSPPDILI
jgi:hypothetical protein